MITELNNRSRQILSHIIDIYVETGEPVGSRTLSRRMGLTLSAATIRNIMSDLEEAGLLYAPHTSAGRLPTEAGLRFFVNGLLEMGHPDIEERRALESEIQQSEGQNISRILEDAIARLSGLVQCAGIVRAPKCETTLKHIEFVSLDAHRVLVVIVTEEGIVENRIIEMQEGIPTSALIEASNYMSARLIGRTLEEARLFIRGELEQEKAQLNQLAQKFVEKGLAVWTGNQETGSLIIRGQSHLLQEITNIEELERLRCLFEALDTKKSFIDLLDGAIAADGIQIFIGSENRLFNLSGCSLIVSPFMNSKQRIVGAIGVIGPTRMNYGRIIPMVDYTARLIGRMIG